jgi:uncharacterized protein
MTDNPLLILLVTAAVAAIFKLWLDDYRANARGQPNPRGFPGATPAPNISLIIAAVGGVVLVAIETAGEYGLGIVAEQSEITWLFGLYMLAAAFGEELVFRGYLYVGNRGKAALWASVVGFSILFATIHPYLWEWRGFDDGGLVYLGGTKAWFSTLMIFLSSLWFYWLRFGSLNPERSLLVPVVAHAALNLSVFGVKLAQGFVVGIW